jgi:uncharacterized membrane protein YhaH (DUF805 family)
LGLKIPFAYIKSDLTVYLAFIISLFLLYVVLSKTAKQIIFRSLSGTIAIVFLLIIVSNNIKDARWRFIRGILMFLCLFLLVKIRHFILEQPGQRIAV